MTVKKKAGGGKAKRGVARDAAAAAPVGISKIILDGKSSQDLERLLESLIAKKPNLHDVLIQPIPDDGQEFMPKTLIEMWIASAIRKNDAMEVFLKTITPVADRVTKFITTHHGLVEEYIGLAMRKRVKDIRSQFNNPNYQKHKQTPAKTPHTPGDGTRPLQTQPQHPHPRKNREQPLRGQPLAGHPKLEQMKHELEGKPPEEAKPAE